MLGGCSGAADWHFAWHWDSNLDKQVKPDCGVAACCETKLIKIKPNALNPELVFGQMFDFFSHPQWRYNWSPKQANRWSEFGLPKQYPWGGAGACFGGLEPRITPSSPK